MRIAHPKTENTMIMATIPFDPLIAGDGGRGVVKGASLGLTVVEGLSVLVVAGGELDGIVLERFP